MQKPEKPEKGQMKLPLGGEWPGSGSVFSGKEVFPAANRRSEEWLSDCSAERAVTCGLMESVSDLSNLERACRHVLSNKGSAGVDGMSVEELGEWFAKNWRTLQTSLLDGSYRPEAVLGVQIPKPGGGYRQLGIPTVRDRMVQQAIHQVLSPRYERVFSDYSYGFRPGRSAHQALAAASGEVECGRSVIVDIDLAKFFDEVNQDRLMWQLGLRIGDKRLLKLIHRFLKSGMLSGGLVSQRIKGTPQGGPLSPLLSNIVLDELDKELERRGHSFARYADDLIIFVSSQRAGHRVLSSMTLYLETRLRLKVNKEKSGVRSCSEVNYLGHNLLRDGGLGLSKASETRLKEKVREITRRNRGVSLNTVIGELNALLRGWVNYFYLARMISKLRDLYGWVKRKLRCYRLKQCKRAITMVRFLSSLGVPRNRAWTTAASRKGWWRKSQTPAAHEGMNNKWFVKVGLINPIAIYNGKHSEKPPCTRVRTVV
jgi:group II intron reverse transcriptase/maturase